MRSVLMAVLFLAITAPAAAQQPASSIAWRSVYAVNAAALSAAMTYCSAKHRNINQGSPGAECFSRARNLLAQQKLGNWPGEIDRGCTDAAPTTAA